MKIRIRIRIEVRINLYFERKIMISRRRACKQHTCSVVEVNANKHINCMQFNCKTILQLTDKKNIAHIEEI